MSHDFLAEARATYVAANAGTLRWMLARKRTAPFLDTKMSPLTLADQGAADGWRGPDHTYGWIQGRGLESLVLHADHFSASEPALAAAARDAARALEAALSRLVARDGGAYFCYQGAAATPVRPDSHGKPVPQTREPGIATFSDLFVWKGLLAARHGLGLPGLAEAETALVTIARRIEAGRFQIDEKVPLGAAALARQPDEFGPRMIQLGACALAAHRGAPAAAAFAAPFVAHVLARHCRTDKVITDEPGGARANPGHAIEFVGFAFECRHAGILDTPAERLADILAASWRIGRHGPGLALAVSAETGAPLSPFRPWWSLPEAIRAAALAYEATGRADMLAIWREAHTAFFRHYWRGEPPIAWQMLTDAGPVDQIPATPDLDPGYHTGLSLLAAIEAVDRMAG